MAKLCACCLKFLWGDVLLNTELEHSPGQTPFSKLVVLFWNAPLTPKPDGGGV